MSTTLISLFFFFNDTATTEIYTLSLHDALPICGVPADGGPHQAPRPRDVVLDQDRKSTRLNSSHLVISYAVFCLKKKKQRPREPPCSSPYSHYRRPGLALAQHHALPDTTRILRT